MGVDQYTSTHHFDALPEGGRISLERDVDDSAGVQQIRAHIREIARAFKAGDFSTPATVHLKEVPGAKIMAERRSLITYEPRDLPRGAELYIRTSDDQARRAIHDFLAFQRSEHHAGSRGAGRGRRDAGFRRWAAAPASALTPQAVKGVIADSGG